MECNAYAFATRLLPSKDLLAAPSVAITLLPSIIAAGVIALGPLGPASSQAGLAAALVAVVVAAPAASVVGRMRFVVSFSIPSLAAVQAALLLTLLTLPGASLTPETVVATMGLCVILSGALIIVISMTGLAELIKFTPHPVLAGFKNGISLTLIWLQLKPFGESFIAWIGGGTATRGASEFFFLAALVAFIFASDHFIRKVPAGLLTLAVGAGVFMLVGYATHALWLGPPVGAVGGASFSSPIASLTTIWDGFLQGSWAPTAQFAVALALFTTLQSLVAFRLAQNLSHEGIASSRALLGVGVGNIVSGGLGGLAIAAASGQTASAYRNGARSASVVFLTSMIFVLLVIFGGPLLAAIPITAVSAIVIFTAVSTLDSWSIEAAGRLVKQPKGALASRGWVDLSISLIVTAVTFGFSVILGVLVGIVVACGVFVLNMSRPVIGRRLTGIDIRSKRGRTRHDGDVLNETGNNRRILQLSGVLFFGNSELLSEAVLRECGSSRTIILDCRGITDIDASGVTILRTLLERTGRASKEVLFCHVAADVSERLRSEVKIFEFTDLDAALEYAEEIDLAQAREGGGARDEVTLETHEFVSGLSPDELSLLERKLTLKEFIPGSVLCRQGDPGDRMWLLLKGSVSIRIATSAGGTKRLSSNGPGTSVGEMAFLEGAVRSATIIADDDVWAYELTYPALQEILSERPGLAAKIYRNFLLCFTSRIRENHAELQAMR